MKKPQWILIGLSIILVGLIFFLGNTKGPKKKPEVMNLPAAEATVNSSISEDTILSIAKKKLNTEQVVRLNSLENSITRGAVKDQQLAVYHQLAHFWSDSVGIFEPFAWYNAEEARLENSEKSLTFAARLFLDNLQDDEDPERRKWKALQAKDLFERSLKINPLNDSARVGLGACYLFGDISPTPMEGIKKIREVAERDSTNTYAQIMLARGDMISGQYDKAVSRLELANRRRTGNLEAMLLLAEAYERMGNKSSAANWYSKCLPLVRIQETKDAIQKRIAELKK